MPKKILAINGSYRRGGVTAQALAEALAGAREAGAETGTVDLGNGDRGPAGDRHKVLHQLPRLHSDSR